MGLGCIRALVGDTAAATSALSCGTNDRDSNELKYLQESLRLVDSLLCWEARDDFEFVTAERTSPRHDKGGDIGEQGGGGEDRGQVKMKRMRSPCERLFSTLLHS